MIYAQTAVEQARVQFTKKWRLRCPAVVESLDEAGAQLFTFLRFPAEGRVSTVTAPADHALNTFPPLDRHGRFVGFRVTLTLSPSERRVTAKAVDHAEKPTIVEDVE